MTTTIGARVEDPARADSTPALITSDSTALSWGEVFDEYAPALISYARSRGVRDPEDLVQDVFVAAVEQLPGFVGDRSGLRSFLFTIAYRRIADEHRRFYRRPETLVAEHSPRPDPGPTVEQVVGRGESASRAMQAFAVLTDRERRVIEMRILEEASPAKVGQALGLSSGNVRVIQARALAKIRTHLMSIGEGGFAQPMVAGGTLTDFVRHLRTELPTDDVLRPWIEEIRSSSSAAPTLDATAATSGATIASGSAAATERGTETAYSLISTVISSGVARLGAGVSVVVLSTLPLVPAVIGGAESSSPLDTPNPVVEVREDLPTPPLALVDDTSRDGIESPADHADADTPTPSVSVTIGAPQPSDLGTGEAAAEGADPPAGELTEVAEVTAPNLVDGVVEPLVEDTVGVLVDDVVEPLVEVVVEVVDDTVELLVDDVVQPLVDDVVQPLVDDLVEPLVDDVVEPLVDDLTDTLDGVVGGLGGFLGG